MESLTLLHLAGRGPSALSAVKNITVEFFFAIIRNILKMISLKIKFQISYSKSFM